MTVASEKRPRLTCHWSLAPFVPLADRAVVCQVVPPSVLYLTSAETAAPCGAVSVLINRSVVGSTLPALGKLYVYPIQPSVAAATGDANRNQESERNEGTAQKRRMTLTRVGFSFMTEQSARLGISLSACAPAVYG